MTLSYEEAKNRQRKAAQAAMQRLYRVRREEAIDAYGKVCVVCGNTDRTVLSIVPKKGWHWSRGNTEKPIRGGHEKLRWLAQNNYPDTHTLVCGPSFSPCRYRLQLVD